MMTKPEGNDLEDVLITEQLSQRPARQPDYKAQRDALAALARQMAEDPSGVLQKLTDMIVEQGISESAGVSIREAVADGEQFRWQALSGIWRRFKGGTMPFDASPCGVAIERDTMVLFQNPHHFFPAAAVEPYIYEILLTPIHADGKPVGSLWVNMHTSGRKFDCEDARLLAVLAQFASAGYQMSNALASATAACGELEQRVRERTSALSDSETRFIQFATASSSILWICDAERLDIEYLSPAFETIYGVGADYIRQGRSVRRWIDLVHPEDRVGALDAIRRVLLGHHATHEFRIVRPDGEVRWLEDIDFPLLDAQGRVQCIAGICQDVTAARESAGRLQVLIAELQHRTRNLIAVVQSLAHRTCIESRSVSEFYHRFRNRLAALARVQGLLSRPDGWGNSTFDSLLRAELDAHGALGPGSRIDLQGPSGVHLPSATVQTLALALHELATNSLKYGALSLHTGFLRINWRVASDEWQQPELRVEWLESWEHGGPARDVRTDGGYGRHLIERALPYQLKARTSYRISADGVRCTIALPLPEAAAALDGALR